MSWRNGDGCPDMGDCDCGQPLCTECKGDADPHECLGGPGYHCGSCVADCEDCQDALERYAETWDDAL